MHMHVPHIHVHVQYTLYHVHKYTHIQNTIPSFVIINEKQTGKRTHINRHFDMYMYMYVMSHLLRCHGIIITRQWDEVILSKYRT